MPPFGERSLTPDRFREETLTLTQADLIYSPWQYLFWYDRPPSGPGAGGAGGSTSIIQDVPELSFL